MIYNDLGGMTHQMNAALAAEGRPEPATPHEHLKARIAGQSGAPGHSACDCCDATANSVILNGRIVINVIHATDDCERLTDTAPYDHRGRLYVGNIAVVDVHHWSTGEVDNYLAELDRLERNDCDCAICDQHGLNTQNDPASAGDNRIPNNQPTDRNTTMATKTGRVLIGYIGVDSGQIMVGDPAYLEKFKSDDFDGAGPAPDQTEFAYSYSGACKASLSADGAGAIGGLGKGDAVVSRTAYGDGSYPVYQVYNDDGDLVGIFVDVA